MSGSGTTWNILAPIIAFGTGFKWFNLIPSHSISLPLSSYIHTYIYGCVFFSGVQILVRVGSSSSANHTHESYPEPYPESYLRIIPPKITIMNVSFGIVWDCMASLVLMDVTSQLTSVGQIRWSLAAFTYLHGMSGEAGWLARWLAAWLARLGGYVNCCCWLGGWL